MESEAVTTTMARRNDVAVKVDAEVVRRAKIVAAYRNVPLAQYFSEALRPIVDRDLDAEQERERQHKGHGPKPTKKG